MKKAEKFFSAFLFIMEEWSLFPKIAYSHSRGGLGEIISPSGCRAEPCPPEAFSFLQRVGRAAEDVVLHFAAEFDEIGAVSGYTDQKGFVLLGVGLSAAQDFVAHHVELDMEHVKIKEGLEERREPDAPGFALD